MLGLVGLHPGAGEYTEAFFRLVAPFLLPTFSPNQDHAKKLTRPDENRPPIKLVSSRVLRFQRSRGPPNQASGSRIRQG